MPIALMSLSQDFKGAGTTDRPTLTDQRTRHKALSDTHASTNLTYRQTKSIICYALKSTLYTHHIHILYSL